MTLVLVEVATAADLEWLKQQPVIQVVGVVTKPAVDAAPPPAAPAPRKWAGALAAISTTSSEEWDNYLRETRNEWERDI